MDAHMSMGDDDKSREPGSHRAPLPETSAGGAELDDRLTIRRMLLLMAGIAVGLVVFAPRFGEGEIADVEKWRYTANAIVIGLAIAAPLVCIRRVIRKRPLAAGGLFALAAGLGVWLLLPAAVVEFVARQGGNDRGTTVSCLYWVMPLMGLWYLLAALVSGHVARKLFTPSTPWVERYGLCLAFLWSPLGVWMLIDIYRDVLR